jgi:hypothetical protein
MSDMRSCLECKYGNERSISSGVCYHLRMSAVDCTCLSYTPVSVDRIAVSKEAFDHLPVLAPGEIISIEDVTTGASADEFILAHANPNDDQTCTKCKHVMYGDITNPRCRKFVNAVNAQHPFCTQVRCNTSYCGGKLFEKANNE